MKYLLGQSRIYYNQFLLKINFSYATFTVIFYNCVRIVVVSFYKWKRLTFLIINISRAQAELRAEKQFFIPNSFNEIDWDNFNLNEEIELNAKEAIEIWFNKIDSNFVEVSNEVR